MVSIGDLPGGGYFSVATAANEDGSYIAGYGTSLASGPASSEAFRWKQGVGLQPLGDLAGGGFGSNAFGISADGSVVVGIAAATAGVLAFRWTEANGMQSIGDLPGGSTFSRANGVSGDGTRVVGQSIGGRGMHAFLWIQGEGIFDVRDLLTARGVDLSGWTLEVATAISSDGLTIVGYGPNPQGNYEGWVAFLGSPDVFGDLDGDGSVGAGDLGILLGSWGECRACEADLNGDGTVDPIDLGLLLGAW
jgi:probable HAF family extracellular repeat protein